MSVRTLIACLSGVALVMACRHHPVPSPAAELSRDQGCPKPDTIARRDSGIDLGRDIPRSPRYRVDSAGNVETLPPVPAAGRVPAADSDSTRSGCPALPDTSDSAPAPP